MSRDEGLLFQALETVRLRELMERNCGDPRIAIGLIDGPVAMNLPEFSGQSIRAVPENRSGRCEKPDSEACKHGTFVAAMLSARRDSVAPAICPGCTLLVRPIFSEGGDARGAMPSAAPKELARAIVEVIDAGARVLNISAALTQAGARNSRELSEVLAYSARRGVLVVAAAGNHGSVGGSEITRHPSVISVVGCDREGRPTIESDLGGSIGLRGLRAPGENVTSLGPDGQPLTLSGTSVAAPFVTGTIALLWSEFPNATPDAIRSAVTWSDSARRRAVVPPLLDAWGAFQMMNGRYGRLAS
jgi:subtilisin family serine protease